MRKLLLQFICIDLIAFARFDDYLLCPYANGQKQRLNKLKKLPTADKKG